MLLRNWSQDVQVFITEIYNFYFIDGKVVAVFDAGWQLSHILKSAKLPETLKTWLSKVGDVELVEEFDEKFYFNYTD